MGLGIFIIIIFISLILPSTDVVEGLSWWRRRRRRKRARQRQRWWNGKKYLLDGAGHGRKPEEWFGLFSKSKYRMNGLPMGHRQDYVPDMKIVKFNDDRGCRTNNKSGHCARGNWNYYFVPVMDMIKDDAAKKFNSRRSTWTTDIKNLFMEKEGGEDSKNWKSKKLVFPGDDDLKNADEYGDIRKIIHNDLYNYSTDFKENGPNKLENNSLHMAYVKLKVMVDDKYVKTETGNRTGAIGTVPEPESVSKPEPETIESFSTLDNKITYEDPRGRGIITDIDTWKRVKAEILNNVENKKNLDDIQNDVMDEKGDVIRSFSEFERDYQNKYTELSTPIETTLESSSRDNIRLKSAIFPSIKPRDTIVAKEGISNMMKEGMSANNKMIHETCVSHMGKCGLSTYPHIYAK